MNIAKNPMQPFVSDDTGTVRFKQNNIVNYLLDNGGINLNDLAIITEFSQDDWTQFAQLIGYSLCGFHELSYVPDVTAYKATTAARTQGFKQAYGCRDDHCEIHCGVEEE